MFKNIEVEKIGKDTLILNATIDKDIFNDLLKDFSQDKEEKIRRLTAMGDLYSNTFYGLAELSLQETVEGDILDELEKRLNEQLANKAS